MMIVWALDDFFLDVISVLLPLSITISKMTSCDCPFVGRKNILQILGTQGITYAFWKWPNQFMFNCSIVFYLVKSSKHSCTKTSFVFFMFFVGSTHFLWNIPGTNSQAKSNKNILVLFATCSKYWLSHVINISVSHISQALPQQGIDLHPCNQHPCSRLRDPVSWRWNRGETAVASSSGFLELHIWSLINSLFFFETFFCRYSIWERWRFLCRCGPNWEEAARLVSPSIYMHYISQALQSTRPQYEGTHIRTCTCRTAVSSMMLL